MTRRHPSLAVVVLAAVCGLAAPAFAQYRPSEPPPEPVPEAAPAPASAPEGRTSVQTTPTRPPGWSWEPAFVLDASYEENVAFTQPPGPNEMFGALAASLARVRRGPRSSFRLAVTGVGYLYPQLHEWDRVDAFANLRTQGPLSRRVDGRLDGNYDFAHTDSEGSLINSGVLLPLVRTQTAGAGAGLTWRLARRTSLALDGTWLQVNFESGPYIDTATWGGSVLLSHQVARRDSLSLQGNFTRTDYRQVSTQDNAYAAVGYSHEFESKLRFDLAGGVSRSDTVSTSLPGSFAPVWGPYGSAGLTGHIHRATLSFRYTHGYQPAIGLGVSQMTDNLTLSATVPIGRRFDLLANGALSLRKSRIVASGPSEKDWDLYTGVSCTLSRRLRLVGGYRFRTRDQSGSLVSEVVAPVRNNRASLSLVYGESGRWRSSH